MWFFVFLGWSWEERSYICVTCSWTGWGQFPHPLLHPFLLTSSWSSSWTPPPSSSSSSILGLYRAYLIYKLQNLYLCHGCFKKPPTATKMPIYIFCVTHFLNVFFIGTQKTRLFSWTGREQPQVQNKALLSRRNTGKGHAAGSSSTSGKEESPVFGPWPPW